MSTTVWSLSFQALWSPFPVIVPPLRLTHLSSEARTIGPLEADISSLSTLHHSYK